MVKFVTYIAALFIVCFSHAQLVLRPIHHPASNSTRQAGLAAQRTAQEVLTPPFWEDFSQSMARPDTSRWKSATDVFINATLGQNAPTYNVATFDGLRSDGRAHNIANNFSGPGDSLVSQPIDLSGVVDENSVYLSFYWQAGGYGEIPDEQDSLRLMFLTDSSTWVTEWALGGGIDSYSENFQQEILQVKEGYLHENFQFKFESASSQQGPFDTWHIDYIYLDEDRNANDLYYLDRSLSGTPTPLFAPYYEVPASSFYELGAALISQQRVTATNLSNGPHPIGYSYILRNENTQEVYFEQSTAMTGFTGFNLNTPIVSPANATLNTSDTSFDSLVISSTFIYNTEDTVFLPHLAEINDTIQAFYTLHNHYAYDDGSAEFAAALNVRNGQAAVKYGIHQPDTLTHVDIYFPNIAPESSGSRLALLVWDELDEDRELVRQEIIVPGSTGLNKFVRFKLNRPLITKDTIYIGYQQFTDNYIGVGFDRNNPDAGDAIYTNVLGDSWEQNERLSGALMIRPVFATDTSSVILRNKPQVIDQVTVFPNPSQGKIRIKGKYERLSLFNLSGQLFYESPFQEEHDVQFLKDGFYLLRIQSGSETISRKLLISK